MGWFGYFAICKVVERFQYGTIWYNMIQLFASIIGVINIVFNIKNECKMAASKIRIKKICEYCGQEFYALKTSKKNIQ